ncbi:transmembrane protein 135-like isoform X2 [Zootermopsis nevadensis]|uniref:transmembrane protein 135-like isoform X2 n=1 Tax=Zootermopsis nevadensis TaxID=136037 RepID=UPI000B8E550D|nr:transmembrane protein 135-like isoform X2 [Zootermopsis nevadensis]
MVVFSKFVTIPTSCIEYVHPWTESCSIATTGLGLHAVQASFRIYVTVYVLALIMRGRVPSQKEIKQTLVGILISSIFLGTNAFAFPIFTCWLRKLLGHFNVLTVGFLPAFFASYVAILLERPSRRSMLALYVTNVATETLFHMAAWRGLVRPVPYGQVLIFSTFMTALIYFYKGHQTKRDAMYNLLRFVVGPYEESGYAENHENSPSLVDPPELQSSGSAERVRRHLRGRKPRSLINVIPSACCKIYLSLLRKIQGLSRHTACSHPFSCTYYTLEGAVKLFALGYSLQVCLRILMQMKRLIRKPSLFPKLLIHRNAFKLGAFLGGFSGIFKLMSCLLRRIFNRDSKLHAIPSGLLAGLTFGFFPDNTIALYVMWKSLQIIYSDGVQRGYVPELPGGTVLLYSFSTAVLFHAGVLEPQNLRPSYWKFLHSISGGRMMVYLLTGTTLAFDHRGLLNPTQTSGNT